MMKTATSVQENAGDILAEAKQINEDRAAEAEAEVVDDFCETEETAEDTAKATEDKEKLLEIHRHRHLRNICRCFCKTSKR